MWTERGQEGGIILASASIVHWTWLRRPDITIGKDGELVDGTQGAGEFYRPGEHISAILTAIQLVKDKETVKQFVNDWGMLGLEHRGSLRRSNMFWGAVDVTFRTKGTTHEDYRRIAEEVLECLGVQNLQEFTQPRETAQDIIEFAGRIRDISKIKFLLNLYLDDPYMAEYEAEAWLNALTSEEFQGIIGHGLDIDFLEEQHNQGVEAPFYRYVLDLALNSHRYRFTHSAERGIWIEIFTSRVHGRPEGFPVIHFDGLFRFIGYVLLADPAPLPQRCADPKCRQLFFPNRAGQNYCPPPPGVKRSRCEQRHNKELQRVASKVSVAKVAKKLPREC